MSRCRAPGAITYKTLLLIGSYFFTEYRIRSCISRQIEIPDIMGGNLVSLTFVINWKMMILCVIDISDIINGRASDPAFLF
jgi:hypothetical protein